jgi:hypothetical protein
MSWYEPRSNGFASITRTRNNMPMFVQHDVYRILGASKLSYAASNGTAASTSSVGSMTQFVQLSAAGSASSTGGVRFVIGDAPVADSNGTLLPSSWIQVYKISPGQKISAISNDAGTGSLNVTELE